jgi:hypothetical protein
MNYKFTYSINRLFVMLFALVPLTMGANMRSPGERGGSPKSASAIVSKHVDIKHEDIIITPNKGFTNAKFEITYYVKAAKAGFQIPLLFYASEFREDFRVSVDSNLVSLQQMPDKYDAYVMDNFENLQNKYSTISDTELKYFEANLTVGHHIIKVEYIADVTTYLRGWVKYNSVGYELWPAKYWKSFGTLSITINNSQSGLPLQTTLGHPAAGNLDKVAHWKFDSLHVDDFEVFFAPPIPKLAQPLIFITPTGIMLIVFTLLAVAHFVTIRHYRKNIPLLEISWIVIVGNIIIPLISLLSYMYAYDLIDFIIGEDASRYHGYTFFIMILYPLVMPIYWIIFKQIDNKIKLKIANRKF